MNGSCGAKILYHIIWPQDEWNLRLVLIEVVTAAALDVGCAGTLLQFLQERNDKLLSDVIDETIASLHARCVAVGDMDASRSDIKMAQLQLIWTMEQRMRQFFEIHEGEDNLQELKSWLDGGSIVWDRAVPTSYTENKMFPMTVRVGFSEDYSVVELELE